MTPLVDLSIRDSSYHKAHLEYRTESLSILVWKRFAQGLPLKGPELNTAIRQISETVVELHRLEPNSQALELAHKNIRDAVVKEVLELRRARFEEKFALMMKKWSEGVRFLTKEKVDFAASKDTYAYSANHISGQIAQEISNDLCSALDRMVKPAIAGYVQRRGPIIQDGLVEQTMVA